MRVTKKFYIKERRNPQLGTYYVACGQLTKKEAKELEGSLYGMNFMLPFDTGEAYEAYLTELEARGERVRR